MKRDKSQRHPKMKSIGHPKEDVRDDGKPDLAAIEARIPELMAAVKSGKLEILDQDATDPDSSGEFYTIFRMRVK